MARKKTAARLIVRKRWEDDRRCIRGARVSEGRERGHKRISEDVQDITTAGLAHTFRLTTVWQYAEIGVSGDAERAALEEAISRIERHEAAWLIVSEVDRLGRDVRDIHDTFHRIHAAGGCVLIADPLLNSADENSRLVLSILAQLAESQRLKIAKKWASAQTNAWRHGVYPGDIPPCYRNPEPEEIDPSKPYPQLQLVPGAAARIRNVARALVDDGISWPMAARMLDGEYSVKGLYHLFASRVLIGEVAFGDDLRQRDAHEPVLTLSDYEAINGKRIVSVTARANQPKHLGAGTLRCAGCRHVLHQRTSGKGHHHYYCRTTWCTAPVKHMPAESADRLLKQLALQAQQGLEFIGATTEGRSITDVDSDINEARARVRAFLGLVEEDPDDQDAKSMWRQARAKVKSLEDERTALKAAQSSLRVALMADGVWEATDTKGRIEAVRSVLDCVFVFPDFGMDPFASGSYPLPLPSKGRSVPRSAYVPTEVRVQALA